jgi:hypothetical protein
MKIVKTMFVHLTICLHLSRSDSELKNSDGFDSIILKTMTQNFRSFMQTGESATTVALCAHFLTSSIQVPSQVTERPAFHGTRVFTSKFTTANRRPPPGHASCIGRTAPRFPTFRRASLLSFSTSTVVFPNNH